MAREKAPDPAAYLDATEEAWLKRLILNGLMARVVLALLFHWTGYSGVLAPDEGTYSSNGLGLAMYWQGDLVQPPERFARNEPKAYFYINAALFFVFGATQIPIKLTNCLVGAFAGRYLYFLTRNLYGTGVARRATTFFMYLPSLLLWSSLNIRDGWVIALILYISWNSLYVSQVFSLRALFRLVVAAWAVSQFRDYLFLVVALPPILTLVIGRRGHLMRNFLLACFGGLALLMLAQTSDIGSRSRHHMSLEAMSEIRRNLAVGGSSFGEEVDISTPVKTLRFLPIGIAYFLFSPFPWQMTSVLKLLSLPEVLVFYWVTPSIVRGLRYIVRERLRESMQVLLLSGLLTVSYALGEGNVGTLYRHRAQVIAFYLMFASVGFEHRRVRPLTRPVAA